MTTTIQWDDSFRVGVEEFDTAHRNLIDMANELIEAAIQRKADAAVADVLDGLIEYTDSHFMREEALMAETDYPKLTEHRRQHRLLLNDVRLFKSQYIAGDVNVESLVQFLTDWILDHIHEHDRLYGPHMKSHGIR